MVQEIDREIMKKGLLDFFEKDELLPCAFFAHENGGFVTYSNMRSEEFTALAVTLNNALANHNNNGEAITKDDTFLAEGVYAQILDDCILLKSDRFIEDTPITHYIVLSESVIKAMTPAVHKFMKSRGNAPIY